MSESLAPTPDGQFDEPLGIKSPLLPATPLGQSMIQRQFLVPLGARPIAILNPSLFLQRTSNDFSADLFQEPAFFPESLPSPVSRSRSTQEITSPQQSLITSPETTIQPKLDAPEAHRSEVVPQPARFQQPATSVDSTVPFIQAAIAPDTVDSPDSDNSRSNVEEVTSSQPQTAGVFDTTIAQSHSTLSSTIQTQRTTPDAATDLSSTQSISNFLEQAISNGDREPNQENDLRSITVSGSTEVLAQRSIEAFAEQTKETTLNNNQELNHGDDPKSIVTSESAGILAQGSIESFTQPSREVVLDRKQEPNQDGDLESIAALESTGTLAQRSIELSAQEKKGTALERNQENDSQSIATSESAGILAQRSIEPFTQSNKETTISAKLDSEEVTSSQDVNALQIPELKQSSNFLVQPSLDLDSPSPIASPLENIQNSETRIDSDSFVQQSLETSDDSAIASQNTAIENSAALEDSNAVSLPSFSGQTSSNPDLATVRSSQSSGLQELTQLETNSNPFVQLSSLLDPIVPSSDLNIPSATAPEITTNSLLQPSFDLAISEAIAAPSSEIIGTASTDIVEKVNPTPVSPSSNQSGLQSNSESAPSQNTDVQNVDVIEVNSRSLVQPSFDLAALPSNREPALASETINASATVEAVNITSIQPSFTIESLSSEPVSFAQPTDVRDTDASTSVSSLTPSSVTSRMGVGAIAPKNPEPLEVVNQNLVQPSFVQASSEQEAQFVPSQRIEDATVPRAPDTSLAQSSSDLALSESNLKSTLSSQVIETDSSVASGNLFEAARDRSLSQAKESISQTVEMEDVATSEAPNHSLVQLSPDFAESDSIAETEVFSQNTTEPSIDTLESSANPSRTSFSKQAPSYSHSESIGIQTKEGSSSFSAELSPKSASSQAIDVKDSSIPTAANSSLIQPSFEEISPESNTETTLNPITESATESIEKGSSPISEIANTSLVQPAFEQASSALATESTIAPEAQDITALDTLKVVQLSSEAPWARSTTEAPIAPQPAQEENLATFETSSNSLIQASPLESEPITTLPSQDAILQRAVMSEVGITQPSLDQPVSVNAEIATSSQAVDATAEYNPHSQNPAILEPSDTPQLQPFFELVALEDNSETAFAAGNLQTDSSTVSNDSYSVSARSSYNPASPTEKIEVSAQSPSVLEQANTSLVQPSFKDAASESTASAIVPESIENIAVTKNDTPSVQPSFETVISGESSFESAPLTSFADTQISTSDVISVASTQSSSDSSSDSNPEFFTNSLQSVREISISSGEAVQPAFERAPLENEPTIAPQATSTSDKATPAVSHTASIQLPVNEVSSDISKAENVYSLATPETSENSLIQPFYNSEQADFSQNLDPKSSALEADNTPAFDLIAEETIASQSQPTVNQANLEVPSNPSIQAFFEQGLDAKPSDTTSTSLIQKATHTSQPSAFDSVLNAENTAAPQNQPTVNQANLEASSSPLIQASFGQGLNTKPSDTTSGSQAQKTTPTSVLDSVLNAENTIAPQSQPTVDQANLEAISNSSTQVSSDQGSNTELSEPTSNSLVQRATDSTLVESSDDSISQDNYNSLLQSSSNHPLESEPVSASQNVSNSLLQPSFDQILPDSNSESTEKFNQSQSSNLEETSFSVSPSLDTQNTIAKSPASASKTQSSQTPDEDPTSPLPQVLQSISVLQPLTETPSTSTPPSVDFESSLAVIQRAAESQYQTASSVRPPTPTASEWRPIVSQKSTPSVQRASDKAELPQASITHHIKNSAIATSPHIQAKYNSESELGKQDQSNQTLESAALSSYIETLAQAVYAQLKQRLRIDQERHGRNYSGRLPW